MRQVGGGTVFRQKSDFGCSPAIYNVKNMPNIPRTDDVGIIMDNFVTYYRELYCNKPVQIPILDRMIDNLTMNLDEIDTATLGTPITMNKV